MKRLLISSLWSVVAAPAWSQGYIAFGNFNLPAGIDAPVFDTDCQTRLEGTAFLAQDYVGFTADSLSPLGPVVTFRTGEAAGYIVPYAIEVPGSGQKDVVYTQMRSWEARGGPTYEAAVASGAKHERSNVVPIAIALPPGPPNDPVGLERFCLIPEPSPATLGWLAAALLALSATRRPHTRSTPG